MGMSPLVELAGGMSGAGAGAALGGMAGGGGSGNGLADQTAQMIALQNKILNQYMTSAINSSTQYTGQAVNNSNNALTTANNQLMGYLNQATNAAYQNTQNGNNASQALMQPYMNAGGGALDALQDSLGLSRPVIGTSALQQTLSNNQQAKVALAKLGSAPTVGAAPTVPTWKAPTLQSYLNGITTNDINNYIKVNAKYNEPYQSYKLNTPTDVGGALFGGGDLGYGNLEYTVQNDPVFLQSVKNAIAQPLYQNALDQQNVAANNYQNQLAAYNAQKAQLANYNTGVSNINNQYNITPATQSVLDAYNKGYFG